MRFRGCAVPLTAALMAALTATPVAASRADITIEGRGFGHGIGMGQWGARGMALDGASWRSILAHYYPGTSLGHRRPGERIRVLVRTAPQIVVTSARSYTLRAGMRDRRQNGIERVRLDGSWIAVERARARGRWRLVTRTRGPAVFMRGRAAIQLMRDDSEFRWYRGTIEVRRRGNELMAINHLPLDEYVMGVVPREMPSWFPSQALAAQAVAARSYAANAIDRSRSRPYDICPTDACQVYGGYGRRGRVIEEPSSNRAVLQTAGVVLTWRGRAILAQYSSSTGGMTANGSEPYLRSVPDPADNSSPEHSWTRRVEASVIEDIWRGLGRLRSIVVWAREDGRRVTVLHITGSRRTAVVSGGSFAARLGLRSRWFFVHRPHAFAFTYSFGLGSRGVAVAELTRRLRTDGFYRGPITHAFDIATRDALRRYQRSRGIRPTGYAGPITRAKLNAEA